MKKWWLVAAIGCLILSIGGVLILGGWHRSQWPDPERVELARLTGAEVRHKSEVQPGTFKINVSLAEALTLAKTTKPIVAYSNHGDGVLLEYWLSREGGGGAFYYASEVFTPAVQFPSGFQSGKIEVIDNEVVVYPEPNHIYLASYLTAMFFVISVSCGGVAVWLRRH